MDTARGGYGQGWIQPGVDIIHYIQPGVDTARGGYWLDTVVDTGCIQVGVDTARGGYWLYPARGGYRQGWIQPGVDTARG